MNAMPTDFPFPACPAPWGPAWEGWGAEPTGILVLVAALAGLILMAAARYGSRS